MNGWALWFALALGADVDAVLPAPEVCQRRMEAADETIEEWKRLYSIAGSWAIERRLIEAKNERQFWELVSSRRSLWANNPRYVERQIENAARLRQMMGWSR